MSSAAVTGATLLAIDFWLFLLHPPLSLFLLSERCKSRVNRLRSSSGAHFLASINFFPLFFPSFLRRALFFFPYFLHPGGLFFSLYFPFPRRHGRMSTTPSDSSRGCAFCGDSANTAGSALDVLAFLFCFRFWWCVCTPVKQ